MVDTIGEAAGAIWQFLNANGEASVNKITTETGLGKTKCSGRSVGWLKKIN